MKTILLLLSLIPLWFVSGLVFKKLWPCELCGQGGHSTNAHRAHNIRENRDEESAKW